MPQDIFTKRKQDILSKQDKSSKGNWDKKISGLCKKINSLENYYTTSSCAGRVVLMISQDKKEQGLFLKVYHDLINFKQLKKDLNNITELHRAGSKEQVNSVKFKQEPCILHVACKTFEDANSLYNKSKLAGLKRSGIISTGNRFVVEMVSTEKLEFPIIEKGRILVKDVWRL